MKIDKSTSILKGNIYGLLLGLMATLMLSSLYIAIWGITEFQIGLRIFFRDQGYIFFIIFVMGLVLHELIHGISWKLIGNNSNDSIQYGIDWKTLTPYAHCKHPIEVRAYCWGIAMPGLLLGILPAFFSLLLGKGWLLSFGILFTLVAGGDMLILLLLRKVKVGTLVKDHPKRVGCYIFY